MKNIIILAALITVLLLPVLSACQPDGDENHTPIPAYTLPLSGEVEAPDDLANTPGGGTYRANVHEQGVENPWPPVQSADVVLGSGSDTLNISYRDYIETESGETRNNIIRIRKGGGLFGEKLELYSVAVPDAIELGDAGRGVGLPGTLGVVLVIKIAPYVSVDQYTFQIGIEVDGKDYGTIPCTISVIE